MNSICLDDYISYLDQYAKFIEDFYENKDEFAEQVTRKILKSYVETPEWSQSVPTQLGREHCEKNYNSLLSDFEYVHIASEPLKVSRRRVISHQSIQQLIVEYYKDAHNFIQSKIWSNSNFIFSSLHDIALAVSINNSK